MRKRRKRLRSVGETVLALIGLWVIPYLPRGAVLALAKAAVTIGYPFARRERRVALANLELIFGDAYTPAQRARIMREAFVTMARMILDLFWFSHNSAARLARYVHFDPSFHHYYDNAPCIALTAHFGNWEAMGLALASQGHPCTVVFTELANPVVDRILRKLRHGSGQAAAERTGVMRKMMRVLRDGGRVGVLLDQNVLPAAGGSFVDFLGLPAPMSNAFSALAARTGVKIVPVFSRSMDDGTYFAYALEPLSAVEGEPVEALTQRIAAALAGEIRRYPGQWLWMYKRWKNVAPGDRRERYPFYARELV